jgi:hypothetical protein
MAASTAAIERAPDALAEQCAACHRSCVRAYAVAVHAGGLRAESPHLQALLDCAELCRLTAEFFLRGSALSEPLAQVCAAAAARCGEDCERFPATPELVACASACWELTAALAQD